MGFGIPLAQSFGAGEKRELHRFLWNGFWVGSFFSVLLTVGTVILAAPLMAAMNTPENIFSEGELLAEATVAKFATVQKEGNRTVERQIDFYNLDVIISVGYRVKSLRGTQFRIWATNILKEYMKKGFALDDDRLKNLGGGNYFEELLSRIRDIRSSEKVFWRKVLEIYATSIDYNPKAESSVLFFKQVQNKMHWAAHKHTAAEVIYQRADADKDNMGLTTWKNAPKGKILRTDVTVSKNYLSQKEMSGLNDIVTMYLDYAENQAKRERLMSMDDWAKKLDAFLQFNEYELLHHKGKVERKVADALAQQEYEKFRVIQDKQYISDFDRATKKILKK